MKWNRIDVRANEIKWLIVTAMLLFVMATATATAQDTRQVERAEDPRIVRTTSGAASSDKRQTCRGR